MRCMGVTNHSLYVSRYNMTYSAQVIVATKETPMQINENHLRKQVSRSHDINGVW